MTPIILLIQPRHQEIYMFCLTRATIVQDLSEGDMVLLSKEDKEVACTWVDKNLKETMERCGTYCHENGRRRFQLLKAVKNLIINLVLERKSNEDKK